MLGQDAALILEVAGLPECSELFPLQPRPLLCFPRRRLIPLSPPLTSQNPEMPFCFTVSRGFWLLLFYYVGLLPFIPIPEKFFMCFLPTIINRYPQGLHLPSSSSPAACPQKNTSPISSPPDALRINPRVLRRQWFSSSIHEY